MDSLGLVTRRPDIAYSYDDEADVLYLSFGQPAPATGIGLDATVVLRLDEASGQVVGLTLIGLRRALEQELERDDAPAGAVR